MDEGTSIIIPVHNGERFLAEAIHSALAQTLPPGEIIIVDDGSTDASAQVAAEVAATAAIPIRCVHQDNQGPAAARNHGLRLAQGAMIAFLDADDLWPETKLADQMAYFLACPDLDVLIGHVETWARNPNHGEGISWSLLQPRWFSPLLGSMLCRRSAFSRVGHFTPALRYGEDVDWLLRAREAGISVRRAQEITLIYRLHEANMVRQRAELDHFSLQALRASLARRRAAASRQELPPIEPIPKPDPSTLAASHSPGVSVIIPVYNGERFLARALDSVMAQRYRAAQIIVVDDGSTDGTAQMAARWPGVCCLRQPNQGNGAAKNRGLAAATQPLVAFLDADDIWRPAKLECQVNHLSRHPELGFVLCHAVAELESGTTWPAYLNQAHYQSDPPLYAPSAMLAWRRAFSLVGPFKPEYQRSNDSDWFLRARDAGLPMAIVPEVLVQKRIHSDSITHQVGPLTRELLAALRASVQRRRGQPDGA